MLIYARKELIMSYKKILICDECKKEINDFFKPNTYFEVGYTHMCDECYEKKFGFTREVIDMFIMLDKS